MKHMPLTKISFARTFILGMLFILLSFSLSQKPVLAQQKASYTIKRYQEVKHYGKIKTTYIFDKPILKGNSAAIKKINQSLEKEYKKSLNDKKEVQDMGKDMGKSMKKHGSNWTYPLYITKKCKVTYNQKGIISFRYYSQWYLGGVNNTYHYGLSYNLNTGQKLQLSNVISGSETEIKTKIWKEYNKKYTGGWYSTKKGVLTYPLSNWYFYLKPGKVIISSGAYTPGVGNGETRIRLNGKY